jgi:hypothetical protein
MVVVVRLVCLSALWPHEFIQLFRYLQTDLVTIRYVEWGCPREP